MRLRYVYPLMLNPGGDEHAVILLLMQTLFWSKVFFFLKQFFSLSSFSFSIIYFFLKLVLIFYLKFLSHISFLSHFLSHILSCYIIFFIAGPPFPLFSSFLNYTWSKIVQCCCWWIGTVDLWWSQRPLYQLSHHFHFFTFHSHLLFALHCFYCCAFEFHSHFISFIHLFPWLHSHLFLTSFSFSLIPFLITDSFFFLITFSYCLSFASQMLSHKLIYLFIQLIFILLNLLILNLLTRFTFLAIILKIL